MSKDVLASECIRFLTEFGGVYYVNQDGFIQIAANQEPVLINNGEKSVPIKILLPNMKPGSFTILNPFVEHLAGSNERTWFYKANTVILGSLVKNFIHDIASTVVEGKDVDIHVSHLAEPHAKAFDKTFLNELERINTLRMLRITYNRSTRTASMSSDMGDEDYMAEHLGSSGDASSDKKPTAKIRKRSWMTVRKIIEDLIQCDVDELDREDSVYVYKSTQMGFPELDSRMRVYCEACKRIAEPLRHVLGDRNMDVERFEIEIGQFPEYHKSTAWFNSGNATKADAPANNPTPWLPKSRTVGVSATPAYKLASTHKAYLPETLRQDAGVVVANEPGMVYASSGYGQPGGGMVHACMPNHMGGGTRIRAVTAGVDPSRAMTSGSSIGSVVSKIKLKI